tara:strand:+ start:418 stop:600 length:183 start_codon:yes stop_codon:yes gene_type:complete
MSKLAGISNAKQHSVQKLNVKDTDFILKLVMRSTFDGSEIEIAHVVLTKIAEMHKANLES